MRSLEPARNASYDGYDGPSTSTMRSSTFTGKERDAETGLDYFGVPESLMGAASPWGTIRARLNEWLAGAVGVPENMRGLFAQGSRDRLDYTNGCLCERSERILRWIRDTARDKTPGVFPIIPALVRR